MSTDSIIQWLHLLAPLLALGGMALCHTLLCRVRPQAAILNMLALAGFAGLGVLFAVELAAIFVGQSWSDALLAMLLVDGPIYGCLNTTNPACSRPDCSVCWRRRIWLSMEHRIGCGRRAFLPSAM